ncbi:MAG: methylenetetrahydrofolate reductase, partial [Pseudomonadota bacterium]
ASFRLWDTVQALQHTAPDFVSVTYGAGGTTRQLTHEAVEAIGKHTGLSVAAHLTCVDASRAETLEIAERYADAGVSHIVALRGDPPKGSNGFEARADGFASSIELIEALAGTGRFEISVGAYPEKHPEAASTDADIDYLRRKIDAGATSAITQFFFENETFLRFRDRCAAAGITVPVIPGVLPVDDFDKMVNFAARCGTAVPGWMHDAYANADTVEAHDTLSLAIAAEQCDGLIAEGVDHIHLYTLNKPDLPMKVCRAMGLTADPLTIAATGA